MAVVVTRTGATTLNRTLTSLAQQTRQPDSLLAVDAGSTDSSAEILASARPTLLVTVSATLSFGSAVTRALQVAPPAESDYEWLWLIGDDNVAAPTALAQLLGAVEIAPSVAIAGPKLMRSGQPDVIAEFGETVTRFGASIALVEGELDQAQHDVHDDVLGIAAAGMLVRRSLWEKLGGFDPALPSIDASLDLCIRARLAGFRVVVVPGAKVLSSGGPELFGRVKIAERQRALIARRAQLHRRLVYSSAAALPGHWLSLIPLAIARALAQLVAKRPTHVVAELIAALSVAFNADVLRARRTFARTKTVRWSAISALRIPRRAVIERRAQAREEALAAESAKRPSARTEPKADFVANGGLWAVLIAALVSVIAFGPLFGASSLGGGQLLPLSNTVGELWSHVGVGWREIGAGFTGAADPFAYVLAVLGSITFWDPSLSIVILYFLSLPLAALGAFFAARRLSHRPWLPSFAAAAWAIAPPLLSSLNSGQLGATLAHILLPWLVLALLNAARSWTSSAAAALLFAVVAACAPSITGALLVLLIALIVARPTRIVRLIGIPVPALALFAPLIVQQFARGNLLALVADPGAVAAGAATSPLHLALLSPGRALDGWVSMLSTLSVAGIPASLVVLGLLAPFGALALLGLCVPGSRRAIPALVLAGLGFATAVATTHISVATLHGVAVPIWPGAALSLLWLGLIASALVALDGIRVAPVPIAMVAGAALVILVLPLLGAHYSDSPQSGAHKLGESEVRRDPQSLPAVVKVGGESRPRLATLVLTPAAGNSLAATIERGTGATLDDQSTLAATNSVVSSASRQIAILAGNLASHSGLDTTATLSRLSIGFVLLRPTSAPLTAVHERTTQALDANSLFTPIGSTSDVGRLWRFVALPPADAPAPAANTATRLGVTVLTVQGIVFGLAILLGVPTVRRRRREVSGSMLSGHADTFDEETDDD